MKAISEAAFEKEKVLKQFNMELVGHLSEHNLPGMILTQGYMTERLGAPAETCGTINFFGGINVSYK